ncbi:LysR family transcriptional regulator [Hydrogenophaga crassostreae]|uniref:LysR family transcriptional regulator n=1 Tax=Hydrogenophaga crassostreae TaxID=1763535 RepID=A0A167GQY0_9BURK|nr:LysR family transcriptional regulator [Hydrogenophaga crassostreae]AOW11686.1 LysR family transcriptional regulator [Hydrogenophaga crassostreae]OAD39778.1 LysR family transcriptional regulator [Hydrogenophaga crassostreae]
MDRFDAMQTFARVVEAGSFTKAAQTLHMSRTTATQLVQQLESRLRVKLLHRTTRTVRLTEDGAVYYGRVVRLLADLEDADTSVSSASAAPKGRLRVDVPSPIARLILMPALPDFHARYPDIQLDMGVSDRMVDLVSDHIDCVLRAGELADSSLTARRVGELPLGVYAAPSYLARCGTPAHPQALEDSPHRTVGFLGARNGHITPIAMRRDGVQLEVQGRYVVAVDDGNAYLAAGLAGMGVMCVPSYMAAPYLAQGELVPLFEEWRFETMPLYVVFPANRHVGAKLRVFMDWVAGLMALRVPMSDPRPG